MSRAAGSSDPRGPRVPIQRTCDIELPSLRLVGDLVLPSDVTGVVLFAHGSGSGRHSPRNRAVARALNRVGLGTLLFDLLTVEEEADRANVFDVDLLAGRLIETTAWLAERADVRGLRVGYFGASTGAAAALIAAADLGNAVDAVVSRGGRPDLAAPRLAEVASPTLLIVGGDDTLVLELNREALRSMTCRRELEIVPGATHLFEEPGSLDRVSALAGEWFLRHLGSPRA